MSNLHVVERGSGPPVLMIHGTGGFSGLFEPLQRELESSHRAIAYDRRGFGQSPGRAERFHDHAEDAAALLDQLGAAPATVVAWSGGGMVGLDLAATHPAAVSKLVLVEPAFHLVFHPTLSTLRMSVASNFRKIVRRDEQAAATTMYRWASRFTTGGNAFDAYPEQWRSAMLAHASTTVAEMDQVTLFHLSRSKLQQVTCPVRCAVGEVSEPAFHKALRALRRQLPGLEVERVPGASHMIPTDQPAKLAEIVRA